MRWLPPSSPLTRTQVIATYAISTGTLAGLTLALAGCGGAGKQDVQVMSFTPAGPIDKAESIVIRFDKPVVGEERVGKPAEPTTVAVTPAFSWTGFWQDRRTLVIDPSAKLAGSTKYEISLTGELAKRTKDFEFTFVHKPIAVEGVWGVDSGMLPPDGDLPISFNQPVHPADAARHCKLVGDAGDLAFVVGAGAAAANLTLRPARPLGSGTSYTLSCVNLVGAGGNLPLAQPYSLAVSTRPALEITSIEPEGDDIAADQVALTFNFTTPVEVEAARKAIRSTPAIPGLERGYISGDGLVYTVTADLETRATYALEVSGLVDTFGQRQLKPAKHTFKTGDARPRLSMERGIYALEASAKGYPVWSRNIGKYDIECATIPKERVVQLLTTDMNYDPWGGNDDDKPLDWNKLKVRAKTTSVKNAVKNKWQLADLDLGKACGSTAGARGVYLAEVRSDEIVPDPDRGWLSPRRNRVLANVTDLGVLIKTGTASGLVWVTALSSGAPIDGATVTVLTPQGKQVFVGMTTADGILKIPGSATLKPQTAAAGRGGEDDWANYRSQRLIAIVEKANDLAIVDGNWSNGIQLWNFGVTEDRRGGATRIRGFIQSDRGLYRPGETVFFKGIAREVGLHSPPRVPAGKAAEIEIEDSRGQTVLTTRSKLSSFGGFAFELPLGADATVGDYYVRAKLGGQVFREKFSVEEFRPATFEIKLASATASPKPGERLTFELGAKYLFGAPASEAKVEWSLRKRAHRVAFKGFDQYTFSANPRDWWWDESADDYGEFLADGTGETDAQGHLAIEARDGATSFAGPVDYILSANVTDEADQTMGKSALVTAHKTGFYLGMHANEFVQAVGMPFGVNLVALAHEGARVATRAKLSFIRTVATCSWNDVGSRSFERCDSAEKVMFVRDVSIANAGSHVERIYPTEPGNYIVKAEAKDAAGNPVIVASEIWVIGKGEAFWSGDEGDRMTLVASKPVYQPGDKARLVAQTNLVKPTALITVERDGIIEARVQKLASASEGIELAIADAWAPNVYASVALVSGRRGVGDKHRPLFKMGLVELKVASEHKQLSVGVALDRATVRPGERVTGKIRVTHGGAPVKAEVALSAADEGVLQLISYQTPNPMKTFYASYGLGVDAGTNWNRIARLADPQAGDPDEGGDGGSRLTGQRVRSRFVASAYWSPMLVTDANGEIAFSFVAPDNLTAYRLMAVASDTGARFGAGELRLTVNKPVMAAPALPRFLRSDDAASVGIVIHNNTDHAGLASVTAKADGATLATTKQSVQVPARGSSRVRFAAKASQNAAATFEFSVALGSETDAVRVTVPIDRPRVIDRRLIVEQQLKAETWSGSIAVGKDVLRKESSLAITIDRTGLGDLAPSLRALVEYPYGCLEQTMSRFVPLVAARDLANTLDEPSLQGTKASAFVSAGIAKVIRHQQGDGLFSLWPQSQTYPHLSAYALWGLTVAEKSGEQVPPEVFTTGLTALRSYANTAGNLKPDGDGATIAMAAYVMALRGHPDRALEARLFGLRAGLPRWGQAFLLRAMKLSRSDPKQLAELKQLVEEGITLERGKATVKERGGGDQYHYMNSDIRATAMTLAALLEVDPNSKLIDPLALGLKAARQSDGTWVSTQENLWSLVALADYGRRAKTGETTARITLGGKELMTRKVVGAAIATIKVPLDGLTSDDLAITIDHIAHVSARITESRVDAGAAISKGFAIERKYVDAAGKPATSFKAGELVTVKLSVTNDAARKWVAMVDPIPAGFEVLNPKLASGGTQQQPNPTAGRGYRNHVSWDHEELRDDRVLWFADNMYAGTFELSYQARATIDGTFSAMPSTIEAMYQPDIRGRTARTLVTVTK